MSTSYSDDEMEHIDLDNDHEIELLLTEVALTLHDQRREQRRQRQRGYEATYRDNQRVSCYVESVGLTLRGKALSVLTLFVRMHRRFETRTEQKRSSRWSRTSSVCAQT